MEDCPICLEPMKLVYDLSCNHSICWSCAKECKKRSTEPCVAINSNFLLHIKNDNPIKCPLCRKLEHQMTVDEFKKYDPETYNEWIQLEFNCDEYGYSYYYSKIPQPTWVANYIRIPKRVTWKVTPKIKKQGQIQKQR
jgi:hypothetical protein